MVQNIKNIKIKKIYSADVKSRIGFYVLIILLLATVGQQIEELYCYLIFAEGSKLNFWEYTREYFFYLHRIIIFHPILFILLFRSAIKLDPNRYIIILKMKSRKKYFNLLMIYNFIISSFIIGFSFVFILLIGLVSKLPMNFEVADYVYGNSSRILYNTNINMPTFVLMSFVSLFFYTFLLGIIYCVFYYITFNEIISVLAIMGYCQIMQNVYKFKVYLGFNNALFTDGYGMLEVLVYWMIHILIWGTILKLLINRRDLVKFKKTDE